MTGQVIYVISHHEQSERRYRGIEPYIGFADYFKIGIAEDPEQRLSHLSGGTPHVLRLVTTIKSDSPRKVESELHRLYSSMNQNGEWFKLTSREVNSLKSLGRITANDMDAVGGYIPDWRLEEDTNLYLEIMKHRKSEGGSQ